MLLACVEPNGNKKVYEITNFFTIPKKLPKLLHTSFDTLLVSVLLNLAGKNGHCYPGHSYLKAACGIKSEKTVHNSLARLRAAKLIKTVNRGTSRSLVYTFLWHPTWEAALSKKTTAKEATKDLKYGDEFNPHGLFDTLVLHKSIMADPTMSPTSKIIMAYVMNKVGTNDCAWPTHDQIMRDTGIIKNTTRLAIKDLEARRFICTVRRLAGEDRLLRNSYYLVFGNTAVADMVEKDGLKSTDTCTQKYHEMRSRLLTNSIKILSPAVVTEAKSNDLPSDHYYELPKPENVVVVLEGKEEVENYLGSLPDCDRARRLRKWYAAVPATVSHLARLKMALQMVSKQDIQNKSAYLNTLLTLYFEGRYRVEGVELLMTDYAKRVDYEWKRRQVA